MLGLLGESDDENGSNVFRTEDELIDASESEDESDHLRIDNTLLDGSPFRNDCRFLLSAMA